MGKNTVARLMTKAVINRFKMVKVDLNDRKRMLVCLTQFGERTGFSNSAPRLYKRVKVSCHACHCNELCRTYMLLTIRRITYQR